MLLSVTYLVPECNVELVKNSVRQVEWQAFRYYLVHGIEVLEIDID